MLSVIQYKYDPLEARRDQQNQQLQQHLDRQREQNNQRREQELFRDREHQEWQQRHQESQGLQIPRHQWVNPTPQNRHFANVCEQQICVEPPAQADREQSMVDGFTLGLFIYCTFILILTWMHYNYNE